MAERTGVIAPLNGTNDFTTITWEGMLNGDSGSAVQLPTFADKTVQVLGTFGSATLTIQGSNNGVDYVTLNDPQGNALTFTSSRIETILENPVYIKIAANTGGGGTTDLDVIIACRKNS